MTAIQFIQDQKKVGLNDSQILELVNGLMLNKINDKNLCLCLEVKNLLK